VRQVSLGRLARVFAWVGLTSVGGGRAAFLYDAFVTRRAWLSADEFVPGLTLSQLLPGPTISNLAIFVGTKLGGGRGAIVGWLAVLVPGALAILCLAALYFERGVGPSTASALRGMGAAVAGFLFVTTAQMARAALRGRAAPWISALTFAAVALLRLNTFLVLLLMGAVSLWINRPQGSKGAPVPPPNPRIPA
jgi:chromate transporter